MRFFPRSAEPIEPLDAARDAEEDNELPLKAQNVLGTNERTRSKIKKKEPPETYIPTGSPPRREDQVSPSPMLPPLNPTEPLSLSLGTEYTGLPNPLKSNPPTGNGRMSPFPNLQPTPKFPPRMASTNDLRAQPNAHAYNARQPQRGPPSVASSSAVQPHQFYPDSKPSIESFESKMREYYDASTQPLYVSQQTSASAVRDHGLRKGQPMISIHESSSDPTLTQLQKPLKSAMKKSQQESGKRKDGEKKGKKLGLGSVFAHQQKPGSPGGSSPAGGRADHNLDFFPEETVRAKLQRPAPHARFETQKSIGDMSNNSDKTVREKVFEKDIYDNTKMNVRRPPKGIQNWFDGFDISSDEEEKMYAREAQKVRKGPPLVELPATEAMQTNGPLPSTFSPYDGALHQKQRQQKPQRPSHNRKASADPVEDNLLAIEHAKEVMKKRAQGMTSQASDRSPASNPSATKPKPQRESESRLMHSRLASQSVLSLSSESGGEEANQGPPSRRDSIGDESVILGNAASVGMHRPHVQPRQLHTAPSKQQENTLRRSISTGKTSGSIPMRLGSDIPIPPIPVDRSTLGSPPRSDPTAHALRRLNGLRDSTSQPSRSRRTTRSAPDDSRSMADRSIAEETTSSATDGSRMMQVSEEEMILLELMRQKRAAMQKNSFSEGYRLALKQEEDHLAKRREGARRTALQMLKAKDEMLKRQSGTSTVFSEDHENPAIAAMRRKYSALHKEDVDKALKLERFLSLDPHGQVQVVPGADRFPAPPIVLDGEELDREEDEPPVLLQAKTYSPMQKLTSKVRDGHRSLSQTQHSASLSRSTTQSPPDALSDEYLEDHHDRVRAFLASNSASEAQELFPTPPNHSRASMRMEPLDEWRHKRGSMVMSPSPVPEEEPVLDDFEAEEEEEEEEDDYERLRPGGARDSRWPEPLHPRNYDSPSSSRSRPREERQRRTKSRSPRPHHQHFHGHGPPERQRSRNNYHLSYTADSDPLLETIGGLAPPSHTQRPHSPSNQRALRDPYPEITPTLESGPLELPTHSPHQHHAHSSPQAQASHLASFPGSPSLSSHRSPSPLTPTFPYPSSHPSQKGTGGPGNFVEIAPSSSAAGGSDTGTSSHPYSGGGARERAYTPDTELSSSYPADKAPAATSHSSAKKPSRRAGGKKNGGGDGGVGAGEGAGGKRSSTGMSSITSAGEDVLAAWAELGGGSADFAFRKPSGGSRR